MEIYRVTYKTDVEIFRELAELDISCLGSDGWSADSLMSEAEKDNGIIIACCEDGHVVGLICGYFAADEADILSLAVSRAHRRKGIASMLMREFEKNLPECTKFVFLEVRESNQPALSLYTKFGFEKLSVRKNLYEEPTENGFVMFKSMPDGAEV